MSSFKVKVHNADPHPSDWRGNSQNCLLRLPKRLDTPTDSGRFSLSHPMGEGRGEGEFARNSNFFLHVQLMCPCNARLMSKTLLRVIVRTLIGTACSGA